MKYHVTIQFLFLIDRDFRCVINPERVCSVLYNTAVKISVPNRPNSVRLPKNIRGAGAARIAHQDLAEAKSNKSFGGARFVGGDTNKLTPEFRSFLADRRALKKKAGTALREVVLHTAQKAVTGSNEVSLRELNHSIRGPKGTKYVKPKVELPTREAIEFANRELERAYKKKLEVARPHTTEFTRSQKFEYESGRIRQKKKNRNAKQRPEGRVIRQKKNAARSSYGVSAPMPTETVPVPQMSKAQLEELYARDADMLDLFGGGVAEKRTAPMTESGRVNDLEQELWGF